MNNYGNNIYITGGFDLTVNLKMKEQEREAILKMLEITRNLIISKKESLDTQLNDQQTELKDFATKKIVSDLKEGLIGGAADAAERQLTTDKVFQPDFENPIKG